MSLDNVSHVSKSASGLRVPNFRLKVWSTVSGGGSAKIPLVLSIKAFRLDHTPCVSPCALVMFLCL